MKMGKQVEDRMYHDIEFGFYIIYNKVLQQLGGTNHFTFRKITLTAKQKMNQNEGEIGCQLTEL